MHPKAALWLKKPHTFLLAGILHATHESTSLSFTVEFVLVISVTLFTMLLSNPKPKVLKID